MVNELLQVVGVELFDELAALSCADIARYTADLDHGLRESDAIAIARSAHALAGVSANIGATRLADAAGMLERATAKGDAEPFAKLSVEVIERSV